MTKFLKESLDRDETILQKHKKTFIKPKRIKVFLLLC